MQESRSRGLKARLVIENAERCYSIADALSASKVIGALVVFDVFHHRWNPALETCALRSVIELSAATWRTRDGRTKIHYSNQWPGQPLGSHSKTISVRQFRTLCERIIDLDIDIMLEVKDKERSVLRLMKSLPDLAMRRAAPGIALTPVSGCFRPRWAERIGSLRLSRLRKVAKSRMR